MSLPIFPRLRLAISINTTSDGSHGPKNWNSQYHAHPCPGRVSIQDALSDHSHISRQLLNSLSHSESTQGFRPPL